MIRPGGILRCTNHHSHNHSALLSCPFSTSALARNCGTDATSLGSVYISRGVGSVSGALFGGFIYERMEAPHVIALVSPP
jgi:predicted MFS family arabinose efflux permease